MSINIQLKVPGEMLAPKVALLQVEPMGVVHS